MIRISLILLLGIAFLTGCSSIPENPPPTVNQVELERYMGTWYEIARLPAFYQDDSEAAMAEYSLTDDGSVRLVNTAIRPDGTTKSVEGTATPVFGSGNARLKVRINAFIANLIPIPEHGNYWILRLDKEYQHALVGTPDRKFLWILSRSKSMQEPVFNSYVSHAEKLGYPVAELIIHDPQ